MNTTTTDELTCRLPVSDDERCGSRAVAIDRELDEPRCADHVAERLWLQCDGWVPKPAGPIAWVAA